MVTTPAIVNDAASRAQHKSCRECLLSNLAVLVPVPAAGTGSGLNPVIDNTSNFSFPYRC